MISSHKTIRNILTIIADPFAEADEDGTSEAKQSQNYIHIRIQRTSPPNNLRYHNTVADIPVQSAMVARL